MDLPPPRRTGPTVSTSIRIPKDILDELKALAAQHGYGLSELILHFLRAGMREARAGAKKRPSGGG